MPGRRSVKKGSFGGHFDELVKVFEPPAPARTDKADQRPRPQVDGASVHDRLFETAWRAAREKHEPQ